MGRVGPFQKTPGESIKVVGMVYFVSNYRDDGAISADDQILGTYLHGLFDATPARDTLLRWAGLFVQAAPDYRLLREAGIDRLAKAVETHLDFSALENWR